jgi:hypothetical protein
MLLLRVEGLALGGAQVFLAKREIIEVNPEQNLPANESQTSEYEESASSTPSEVFVVVTQPQ